MKPVRKLTKAQKAEHERYLELVKERMPKSRTLLRCLLAFLTGGAICCLGQLIGDLGEAAFSLDEAARGSFTSVVLIFIAALLTGLGVYDKIGAFAGAGSVIPITGFSNSIVAPAMEPGRDSHGRMRAALHRRRARARLRHHELRHSRRYRMDSRAVRLIRALFGEAGHIIDPRKTAEGRYHGQDRLDSDRNAETYGAC